MAKLGDVCRHVRSKNAGPFWVTVDLFFDGQENFDRYYNSPALHGERVAQLCGTASEHVRRIVVADLLMIKLTYPRRFPQGGICERDMHSGQQYVRFLDLDL
jgi:hypothetical protein